MTQNIILLFSIILLISCVHPPISPKTENLSTSPICSPDTAYFKNQILPTLISNCAMSGCHDAISKKEGVILTDYSQIMKTAGIKPGNASKSELYEVLIESDPKKIMPPPPHSPMDVQKIEKIKLWINQGALNNACIDCDTSATISYSSNIAPLMQLYCNGCHNSTSPSAGIVTDQYNSISDIILNGKLLGSIEWASGVSPMPKGAPKLSSCNINMIKKWINDGYPNN